MDLSYRAVLKEKSLALPSKIEALLPNTGLTSLELIMSGIDILAVSVLGSNFAAALQNLCLCPAAVKTQ